MDRVSLSCRRAVNFTATGTIPGNVKLAGFYVNSTTGGSFTLKDGSGVLTGTITPAVGWHFFPYEAMTSLVVTISGTINVTFLAEQ